jgi:hypothetical protein
MTTGSEFHVRIAGVIGMCSAQSVCKRILLRRNCHKMNMIAHQTITPPANGVALAILA